MDVWMFNKIDILYFTPYVYDSKYIYYELSATNDLSTFAAFFGSNA